MRLFYTMLCTLFACTGLIQAQDTVYVNTDNLVFRDRPDRVYNVLVILRPACPLTIGRFDEGYANDKKVKERFYRVSFRFTDNKDISHYVLGWVDKKYTVRALEKVNYPGADKTPGKDITELMMAVEVPYSDNEFNAGLYPPPKYKGADKQLAPLKRVYHTGPRGGCYYKNAKGNKMYVDKKFCK